MSGAAPQIKEIFAKLEAEAAAMRVYLMERRHLLERAVVAVGRATPKGVVLLAELRDIEAALRPSAGRTLLGKLGEAALASRAVAALFDRRKMAADRLRRKLGAYARAVKIALKALDGYADREYDSGSRADAFIQYDADDAIVRIREEIARKRT